MFEFAASEFKLLLVNTHDHSLTFIESFKIFRLLLEGFGGLELLGEIFQFFLSNRGVGWEELVVLSG